jgi:hypothetical protein
MTQKPDKQKSEIRRTEIRRQKDRDQRSVIKAQREEGYAN